MEEARGATTSPDHQHPTAVMTVKTRRLGGRRKWEAVNEGEGIRMWAQQHPHEY